MPASHVPRPAVHRSTMRGLAATTTVCLLALAVTGCGVPDAPGPTPTTLFATEEEAFAAAEETYRAYVDAMNSVDLENSSTFDEPLRYTSGDFEQTERKNLSTMHANGLHVSGRSVVVQFRGSNYDPITSSVEATACLDVQNIAVVNDEGISQVTPDRPPVYLVDLRFGPGPSENLVIRAGSSTGSLKCESLQE